MTKSTMKIKESNESHNSSPNTHLFESANHEVLMQYSDQSPCSPSIISTDQINIDPSLNSKYIATSPDPHRYVVETYRSNSHDSESNVVPTDYRQISNRRLQNQLFRNEDSYNGIDIQRVPEYSHCTEQRDIDMSRIPIEMRQFNDRHVDFHTEPPVISFKEGQISPRTQEQFVRNHVDPQRLIQESLLREYFTPRVESYDQADDVRYAQPDRLCFRREDADILNGVEALHVDGSDTSHSLTSEVRVSPPSVCVMPENLCLSESTQIIPENLHIDSNLEVNGDVSRRIQLEMPGRTHYDANVICETFRNVRAQSPQYVESYSNIVSQTPVQESPATRYYSYTTPQPHLVVQHQFNNYITDIDGDYKPMSEEERIERGYHDIKPFDQEYPLTMPVMHLSQELAKPKLKKPKDPKPPRTPVVHQCNQCDRTFKNSTQLKNHMWRHTGEKPFTCEVCGSKFTQQGNLRAHKRIHTGERPYHCTECKASFTQLSTLKTHQKIHSNERPYKCSECDAAFRQVANLKTHQVTHTGERPHKCDLCEKAFTQKSNLKAHRNRVHTVGNTSPKRGRRKTPAAIKPFTCSECGSKFTVMSNLKIHMKLHEGQRPFECEYCGAGFAQRSNLKTHVQRLHGKTLEQSSGSRRVHCDECPATFRLKRCLKTHQKKRHPVKSLKIKILRQSQYHDGHSCDEDTDCHGEESENEERINKENVSISDVSVYPREEDPVSSFHEEHIAQEPIKYESNDIPVTEYS